MYDITVHWLYSKKANIYTVWHMRQKWNRICRQSVVVIIRLNNLGNLKNNDLIFISYEYWIDKANIILFWYDSNKTNSKCVKHLGQN